MIKRIDSFSDIELALPMLKKLDPNMAPIIDGIKHVPLRRNENSFENLAKIVNSQLISLTAADAIWGRLKHHFGDLTPENISQTSVKNLKDLGLSGAKARTMHGIAKTLIEDPCFLKNLNELEAHNALKQLISLKGIGPWTAEVYLMFCICHPDIFPSGDVALRTAAGHVFFNGQQPDDKSLRQNVRFQFTS